MSFYESFSKSILNTTTETFNDRAFELFDYQYHTNLIYGDYCKRLGRSPKNIRELTDIPFLPIDFFRNHTIKSEDWQEETIFQSSGTTLKTRSKHFVRSLEHYDVVARTGFETFYGNLTNYQLLALLPSYQMQSSSSLIAMVDHFLMFTHPESGYFLNDPALLAELAKPARKILIGVSYALLDVVEKDNVMIRNGIVMETGGMKGRRKELVREELHQNLMAGYGVSSIHSEYGMTELTSQAYATSDGNYAFPKWAQVLIRDTNDPFSYVDMPRSGGVNVIDLANVSSCAFIETMDLGQKKADNRFRILGRFDNSDVRGCNLLVT